MIYLYRTGDRDIKPSQQNDMSFDTDLQTHEPCDDPDCKPCHLQAVKDGDIDADNCAWCSEEAHSKAEELLDAKINN